MIPELLQGFFRLRSELVDDDDSLGNILYDLGIVLMLRRMDARFEIIERIVREHGHLVL